jgi:YVTN family beta-propeller protein
MNLSTNHLIAEVNFFFQAGLALFFLIMFVAGLTSISQAASSTRTVPFAYITNEGNATVSVIDTGANSVVATIPVGDKPSGIAVNIAGSHVYVANSNSNTISVIATSTNKAVATIPVGSGPSGIAVNPAETYVYVANYFGNNVSVISARTNKVVAAIPVGSGPSGIAVNISGSYVYIANSNSNNISVISAKMNKVIATIPVGSGPSGIAVNRAETYVYVANHSDNNISVIAVKTNKVVAAIPVGTGPYGIAVNPSGTYVYVVNDTSNNVSVIATKTNRVVAAIPVGKGPYGVTVNPAGTYVYVANNESNDVSVIATSTNKVVARIPVGASPAAFGSFIGRPSTYSISATAGSGGSISPAGKSTVNSGDSLSYTIKPSGAHSIASVVIDGVSVGAVGSYNFPNITENHTISAVFSTKTTYSISGTIKTSGGAAMPGVPIILSGAKTGTTNTDSKGSYSFTGLPNGTYTVTYTVTPGLSGNSSTPSNKKINGTNSKGQDLAGTAASMSFSMLGKVTTACIKLIRSKYGEAIFTNTCSYDVYVNYCYVGGVGGWTLGPGDSVNTYTTNFISYAACEDKMGGMWDPVTNESLGSECDTDTGQYNATSFVCSVFE